MFILDFVALTNFFFSRTFVWMTAGLTFASFVLGGLTWWMPTYVKYAYLSNNQPDDQYVKLFMYSQQTFKNKLLKSIPKTRVAKIFGLVTLISGFIGVLISTCLSSRYIQ